jgi:hypothetical protein
MRHKQRSPSPTCIDYDKAVDVEQLAKRFPNLWHVTFAGGWDGIDRHGLLRTIDVAPLGCEELRPEVTRVEASDGLQITLRNQLRSRVDPTPSLDGVTPAEWWRLVNSRVYFFCRQSHADQLVASYLGQHLVQEVIKLRTGPALELVADNVEVTTVNVGVFPRTKGPSRGPNNFVPLDEYPVADVGKIREITVAARVPLSSSAITSVVRHDLDGVRSRPFP